MDEELDILFDFIIKNRMDLNFKNKLEETIKNQTNETLFYIYNISKLLGLVDNKTIDMDYLKRFGEAIKSISPTKTINFFFKHQTVDFTDQEQLDKVELDNLVFNILFIVYT